ncbi:MAG: hypothetical protein MJE66_22675 [Proteobacteria bacterium]|nr:hypothetical protein [Pseudomonadota bacterium]
MPQDSIDREFAEKFLTGHGYRHFIVDNGWRRTSRATTAPSTTNCGRRASWIDCRTI